MADEPGSSLSFRRPGPSSTLIRAPTQAWLPGCVCLALAGAQEHPVTLSGPWPAGPLSNGPDPQSHGHGLRLAPVNREIRAQWRAGAPPRDADRCQVRNENQKLIRTFKGPVGLMLKALMLDKSTGRLGVLLRCSSTNLGWSKDRPPPPRAVRPRPSDSAY